MTARALGVLLIVASGLPAGCGGTTSSRPLAPGTARGENVLLITIDTLRADRVGAYGSQLGLTPTIDALARSGIRFEDVHAHVPLTLPSHATLLTGRYPTGTGLHDNGSGRLDASIPTLASTLKSAGFETAAFVGAFVLDARFGLASGFGHYDDRMLGTGSMLEVVQRPAEQVLAAAADWIIARNSSLAPRTSPANEQRATRAAPWFVWIHLYDPHEPYAPPEPYRSRYSADEYAGEIAYVDASLAAFLERLRRDGALQRTAVVVTSDHGESLGEHGERTHGLFAYESTLRVPLVLSGEAFAPAVVSTPARLVDIMPTLLDLASVPPPAGLDGRSLVAAAQQPRPSAALEASYFEALSANLSRHWAPLRGVTADHFKLIDLPIPELYDLSADPNETRNLYATNRERAKTLEAVLDRIGANAAIAPTAPIDADAERRLRSLGYVGGSPDRPDRKYTAADDPKQLVHLHAALERALEQWSSGAASSAIETLRGVIRERPDLTLAYDRLAFMLETTGRAQEAVALLDQAARDGHADPILLRSLAGLLRSTGSVARSVSILEVLAAQQPDDLQTIDALGQSYARIGRPADAEAMFRRVLTASPNAATTWSNLGALYLAQNRDRDAIDPLSRAIAIDPALAGAHNALGVAYIRRGDRSRAISEWQEALRLRPEFEDARANLERVNGRR